MAVYGDMLSFFPELFRMFDYFHMSPQAVASYSTRESLGQVRGVFQYVKKGDLIRENDTEADVNVPTLWTRRKLQVGDYFIVADDTLFRITTDYPWKYEGGFYCYGLETFVGNSDVQEEDPDVSLGENDYA